MHVAGIDRVFVVPADVEESRLPTAEELELIREVIDPEGAREKDVPDPA